MTETTIKTRVFYKAYLHGTVAADYGEAKLDGNRYWNYEIDYIMRYNHIDNNIMMHQDIELKYATENPTAVEGHVGDKVEGKPNKFSLLSTLSKSLTPAIPLKNKSRHM